MKKLKHEAELFRAALLAGIQYAEGRKAVEFESTDSASDKALYVYRLLVHDKLIAPDAGRSGRREDDPPSARHLVCASIARGASPVEIAAASAQAARGHQSLLPREWAYRSVHDAASYRHAETPMSKGMDRKKEGKKKPAKSAQEKRAAKKEKKQNRGFL